MALWDLLLIVVLVVFFFGAKRLPELGRGMGQSMREFKHGLRRREDDESGAPAELPASPQDHTQQLS